MRTNFMTLFLTAGLFVSSASFPALAQETSSTPAAEAPHSWTMEQAVTSTVHEAWILGGRTEDGFFQIVQALMELSAQKRGITLPDDKAAGVKAGNWIKKQAKKDPDQLLYVICDHAVQFSARKAAAAQ